MKRTAPGPSTKKEALGQTALSVAADDPQRRQKLTSTKALEKTETTRITIGDWDGTPARSLPRYATATKGGGGVLFAVVGERLRLAVLAKGPGKVRNVRWTVTGRAVRDYQMSSSRATVDELPPNMTTAKIDFCWTEDGQHTVTLVAEVDGTATTETLDCVVKAPSINAFNVSLNQPHYVEKYRASGSPALALYVPGIIPDDAPATDLDTLRKSVGCFMWADADAATVVANGKLKAVSGDLGLLQQASTTATFSTVDADGSHNYRMPNTDSSDPWDPRNCGVDCPPNTDPPLYAGPEPMNKATGNKIYETDSPSFPLHGNAVTVAVDFRFRLFLMYRPTRDDAIWVPLARVEWSWRAGLTRHDTADPTSQWNPQPTNIQTNAGNIQPWTEPPTWTQWAKDKRLNTVRRQ